MGLEALLCRTYLRVMASDPRDLYALLGISTNEDWLALKIG